MAIPTPFMVGRVNCYLIEDDPLTLVDTGPNSGKALDCLERELASHGRRIEDLGRIVITHQHLDHMGLLDVLALQAVQRLAGVGAGVDQRQRVILDQVAVDPAHHEGGRDRHPVDRAAHERMSCSTSSRRRSMSSLETRLSRFRRSSGSVFDARTLKCQSS